MIEITDRVLSAVPEMIDVLAECLAVLDDYSDVNDGEDGQPRPNRAMSLMQEIEAVFKKAGLP